MCISNWVLLKTLVLFCCCKPSLWECQGCKWGPPCTKNLEGKKKCCFYVYYCLRTCLELWKTFPPTRWISPPSKCLSRGWIVSELFFTHHSSDRFNEIGFRYTLKQHFWCFFQILRQWGPHLQPWHSQRLGLQQQKKPQSFQQHTIRNAHKLFFKW